MYWEPAIPLLYCHVLLFGLWPFKIGKKFSFAVLLTQHPVRRVRDENR